MRVAVVDIGTNSTRLLVADVAADGTVDELERRTTVTRLGEGVDATGRLGEEPMQRVLRAVEAYHERWLELGADTTTGVLTSAVRDAANGAAFTALIRERFGLDARTIPGAEEAGLTFAGATSERPHDGRRVVVVDIGGGSTELVVGRDGLVDAFDSVQAGVVRMTERHLADDPPAPDQLAALGEEVRALLAAALPADLRASVEHGIAVAGTATSAAAMALELEPYDPDRVHGHVLDLATLELLLARLAAMPNPRRREVVGLHPDRAPTIVAGLAMLIECARAFGLERLEVSEHDVLRGAALARARLPGGS